MRQNKIDFIQRHSQNMNFFQTMRLLELSVTQAEKIIQLHSTNDLQFSPHEIRTTTLQKNAQSVLENIVITVAFMGIAGAQGGLPLHYTELLLRHKHHHQTALTDFLDIFNHRSLMLFYKSWKKNHFFVGYEKHQHNSESVDLFTEMVRSLIGIGTPALRQLALTPESLALFHAGHYAHSRRSASALANILSSYFAFPVRVLEWQGEWLSLSDENCTTLRQNNRLGINTIAGKKIWSAQHKIRLRIGPIHKNDIAFFNPCKKAFKTLCNITREFIGPTLKFDLQLIVKSKTLSLLQLDKNQPLSLGWDTWMKSNAMPEDVNDIVLKEEILL